MRVLVLGADGMLGHKMFQILSLYFDTWGTVRRKGYLVNEPFIKSVKDKILFGHDFMWESTEEVINRVKPQVVVNCIGIVKQRKEDSENYKRCIYINALLPHLLSERNVRLITFSSDCVFDGSLNIGTLYDELSRPNALSLYGKTKHLGEVVDKENALTIRTSMIGREIKGFYSLLEWFLSQKGKTIKGYTQAIYSGVTTNYLAEFTADVINTHKTFSGLFHLTSDKPISKYDLLSKLIRAYNLNIEIEPYDLYELDKVCNRGMSSCRFIDKPSWDDKLIPQLVNDPSPYEEWRKCES